MSSSKFRVVHKVLAVTLLGAASLSIMGIIDPTEITRQPPLRVYGPFDFDHVDMAWVEEFQSFGAFGRTQEASLSSTASKPGDVADPSETGDVAEAIIAAPAIAPVVATSAPVAQPDAIITGSLKPGARPLLPPVPSPDAYKLGKGDRLLQPNRSEADTTSPATPTSAQTDLPSPHAELAPDVRPNSTRRTGGALLAALPRKPAIAGPTAADPTIDPNAPVDGTLAYTGGTRTQDAPFRALFARPEDEATAGMTPPVMADPVIPRAKPKVAQTAKAKPVRFARLHRHRLHRWSRED